MNSYQFEAVWTVLFGTLTPPFAGAVWYAGNLTETSGTFGAVFWTLMFLVLFGISLFFFLVGAKALITHLLEKKLDADKERGD